MPVVVVLNEADLGKAIKQKKATIEIEGELKDRVCSMKALEKESWNACMTQISMAVSVLRIMTQVDGIDTPASVLTGTPILEKIISFLGNTNAFSAIMIARAGGGVGILNQLRKYQIAALTEEKLILNRHSEKD